MYHKIAQVEAKKMIESCDDITILDVRYPEELEDGYIENSINIPVDVLAKNAEDKLPDKHKKILVYCRSGKRSMEAAKILSNMGYEQVYDFGGIMTWPFEVVM